MRKCIILLIFSLFTYSSSAVSGVAVDLKASQSVNTGSNVKFKITVTVSGTESADSVTIKAIEGLLLVKSDDDNTNSTVTCTVSTATKVVKGTPQDFDCTAQSLTTAGTYKLAEDGEDFELTGTDDNAIAKTAVTGSATMEVKTATGGDAATPTTGSGKFLAVSSLFTLLFFF